MEHNMYAYYLPFTPKLSKPVPKLDFRQFSTKKTLKNEDASGWIILLRHVT